MRNASVLALAASIGRSIRRDRRREALIPAAPTKSDNAAIAAAVAKRYAKAAKRLASAEKGAIGVVRQEAAREA